MRIAAVDIYTVDLPLAEPFRHASSGLIDRLAEVVVRVETGEGAVGWGEVRGNAHYVTGETPGRIVALLRELLVPRLLASRGETPAAYARVLAAAVPGASSARAVLDIAIHDATARALGLPLRALFGGSADETAVHVHGTIPFCPPETAAERAKTYLGMGITTIKVRLGLPDFADDLARLAAIAEAVSGAEVKIAADVNQGWAPKEALAKARRLEEDRLGFPLAWLEQPVPAGATEALRALHEAVALPVFADESCGTPEDLLRLIEARAVDGVHLKLCKAGGMGQLGAMTGIAEAAGLPYLVGQMDEGMLATAAALAVAAAAAPLSCELWGFQRVARQPFSGIAMQDGAIRLPALPGLGIEVDESGLTHVARLEAGQA